MQKVTIYTDGACSGNPGPGGWASILIAGKQKKELYGAKENTTNNIMELTAIIEGLKALKIECEGDVYSDSAYSVNAFNQGWIYNWIKKGWKTAAGENVKNQELWQELYELTKKHKVTFHKVKGHSNDELNNRCDELARKAIDELKKF